MLYIILNEIRALFRNGPTIFFSVLFPSLMAFFLGTMLENVNTYSDSVVGELNIAYCIENADKYSADAFETFILAMDSDNTLKAEKISSDELQNISEKYSAAVELNGSEIVVYNGKDAIQNRTVKAIMDGYNQTASAYMTVVEKNPQSLGSIEISEDNLVKPKDFGGRPRTMMDYYAVAMTVTIIFFGTIIAGMENYRGEYTNKTIYRLDCAPVNPTKVYFAKIIGQLPLNLVQVGTVMIVSMALFGAKYCSTLSENLLLFAMFMCASLAATAVGVIVGFLLPRANSWAVCMPINWVLLYFSGAFSGDVYIAGISDYLPPRIILNAAFDLTTFSRTEQAISVIIWSLVIFAVLIFIGWLKVNVRRKKV